MSDCRAARNITIPTLVVEKIPGLANATRMTLNTPKSKNSSSANDGVEQAPPWRIDPYRSTLLLRTRLTRHHLE